MRRSHHWPQAFVDGAIHIERGGAAVGRAVRPEDMSPGCARLAQGSIALFCEWGTIIL